MFSNTRLENVNNPTQFQVLQDLFRLITSEWLCVNMYIGRDLKTIEWRLEDNKIPVSFHDFEVFLSNSFKLRLRINKYSTLVEEQLQFCNIQKPASWNASSSTSPKTSDVFNGIIKDLSQVQEAIQKKPDTNRSVCGTHDFPNVGAGRQRSRHLKLTTSLFSDPRDAFVAFQYYGCYSRDANWLTTGAFEIWDVLPYIWWGGWSGYPYACSVVCCACIFGKTEKIRDDVK